MSMYCQVCLDSIQNLKNLCLANKDRMILMHHKNAKRLKRAAAAGCHFCNAIWNQFDENQQRSILDYDGTDDAPEEDLPWIHPFDESIEVSRLRKKLMRSCATICILEPTAHLDGPEPLPKAECTSVTIQLNPSRRVPRSGQKVDYCIFLLYPVLQNKDENALYSPSSSNTISPDAWAIAEGWISECMETHPFCNTAANSTWTPSRLLDLRKVHSCGTAIVIETSQTNGNGNYMTLSHRWSSSNPLCLTRDTSEQLFAGVFVDTLPQAFQDAIVVCQRLGVSYLWIDSLCIMQDDDDMSDWVKEAAMMHKIYSHSSLNISALAAADSGHSFFAQRNPELVPEAEIETALTGVNMGTEVKRFRVIRMLFWDDNVSNSNLNLRGWVLQERLLAPRVLHFGQEQLFWECQELNAAERYPKGLPLAMSNLGLPYLKVSDAAAQADRLLLQKEAEGSPKIAHYRYWSRIVEAYAKCALTRPRDKLMAIAGIAKDMVVKLEDEYVVGMWRRYLASELLWHVRFLGQTGYNAAKRASEYRAPSFSWASVDGAVRAGYSTAEGILIEVIDVDVQYANEDKTGLVTSGSLLLKCQLQRLEVLRSAEPKTSFFLKVNGNIVHGKEGKNWEFPTPQIHFDEHLSYFNPASADQSTLFCVPGRVWDDATWLDILLLQLVDAEQGTYRRFGLVTLNTPIDIEHITKRLENRPNWPVVAEVDSMDIIRLI